MEQISDEKIEKAIANILDEIGIKINCSGYKYWIEAVKLKLRNKNISIGTLRLIIANKYKTSPSCIERALRHTYEHIKRNIQEYFKFKYSVTQSIILEAIIRNVKYELHIF